MFDIGWGELVVIGVVALVAIGPKELPGVLRSLGQWMGKIRRMSAEFQGQFQEALREAEMSDLKKQAEDIQSSVSSLTNFDPLAATEPSPATESADAPPAPDTAPQIADALPPPAEQVSIDVALPEPPPPVTAADFTPPATTPEPPPAKAAGSGA